jgi:DNA polymerase III subunit epsilon
MREIVLDTETTGLDPKKGHRLIEIGAVELFNRIPTGREFHAFINPERDVPDEASAIHGITADMLVGKPLFRAVARDFLAFIGEDDLVIHNAQFDINFLNFELGLINEKPLSFERVVDTLAIARRRHPAGPNTLDALCKRYNIDNSQRIKHGALVDSLLLAAVYVELLGERQAALGLQSAGVSSNSQIRVGRITGGAKRRPEALPSRLNGEEIALHRTFIGLLSAKAIWLKFFGTEAA